jgi:hypothetical protein
MHGQLNLKIFWQIYCRVISLILIQIVQGCTLHILAKPIIKTLHGSIESAVDVSLHSKYACVCFFCQNFRHFTLNPRKLQRKCTKTWEMCAEMTVCVAHNSSNCSRVFKKAAGNRWKTIFVQAVQFPLGLTKMWGEKKLHWTTEEDMERPTSSWGSSNRKYT